MKTKKFDNLGIEPSLLGFGCMRFPLDEDGKINEKEAEKMIDKAIGSGVTYIDTAFPYHNGDSEPFVGKVLKKYKREDFFLATKLPIWNVSSKEEAKKVFEDQLSSRVGSNIFAIFASVRVCFSSPAVSASVAASSAIL